MNNQGLLSDLIQTTTPTYVDGKFGKAMSTGGYKMSASQTAQVLNNEAISICFWVYINAATGTTDNRVMFFGNNDISTNNNRKFSLFNYPSVNDLHWSWRNDVANTTFTNGVLSGVLPSYQWTHVAVTYQNPNGAIYINGEKVYSFTGVSSSSTFAYDTQVIHNSTYLRWNDYRIYDNCLSEKEIIEIYNSPVCHFKLSNYYETGQVNKYSGSVAEGYLTGSFTCTKLEDERGYNYKLTYTGNGNNSWPNMRAENFSFTVGKRYYYSCKVRCRSANFVFRLRAARSNNDWVTNSVNVLSNQDGEWHEYIVSQIVNETYNRSGSTVTCNPVLEFYSYSLSTEGKVYSADFDIKDIQVIESDCPVPFIENIFVSSTVSDTSGYSYNGLVSSTPPEISDNSPRYNTCYKFSNKTHIKFENPFYGQQLSQLTVNVWVKLSDGCGGYPTILSTYNNPTSSVWLAVNGEGSGEWSYQSSNSPQYCRGSSSLLSIGQWYMITYVFDNGTAYWYLNGERKGNAVTYSKSYINMTSSQYLAIGNSYTGTNWNTNFVGYMSDFRMYSVVLSEQYIKDLYSVAASVDNSGNIFSYEFIEE